jgi:rubrerythrin
MTKKLHHHIEHDKDYSKAIKGEQEAQVEYEELAEEHPEHKRSIKEIQQDEKHHEVKLKRLKKSDKGRSSHKNDDLLQHKKYYQSEHR